MTADKKVMDFPVDNNPDPGDWLSIIDESDTSDDPLGSDKRITIARIVALAKLINETTPQLGADLDLNGFLVGGRDIAIDGIKLDTIAVGATVNKTITTTITGDLTLSTGVARYYPPKTITIGTMKGFVGTAPSGTDLIFKLLKNGTIIASCTITDGQFVSSETSGIATELSATDYLTLDITQVGSTVPGSELFVRINY